MQRNDLSANSEKIASLQYEQQRIQQELDRALQEQQRLQTQQASQPSSHPENRRHGHEIWVKTPTGKVLTLHFDQAREMITGLDIKKAIQEKEGLPIESQRIISCGAQWPDDWTESKMKEVYSASHRDVGLGDHLHLLVMRLIPEYLKSLADMNYQTLKSRSVNLACQVSQITRAARYLLPSHPDAEIYWNTLNLYQRAEILKSQDCDQIISSLRAADSPAILQASASVSQLNNPPSSGSGTSKCSIM